MQQRSLWDDMGEEETIIQASSSKIDTDLAASVWQRCQKTPLTLKETDINAMRDWLLAWGKRNGYPGFWFPFSRTDPIDRRGGVVYSGEARWKQDMTPPHTQQEWYAGEWLVKCIEQVKRYDTGIEKMAWVEFDLGKTNAQTHPSWEDEE
jgi:hypothetical protein